jgi:hypothetical protein
MKSSPYSHTRITLVAMLLAILATSCRRGVVLLVFNHAGFEVTVFSYDSVGNFDSERLNSGEAHELGWPSRLSIHHGTNVWKYDTFSLPANKYLCIGGFHPDFLKLQVEKDGAIYVISPLAKHSVTNFPVQPSDFPLHPKK